MLRANDDMTSESQLGEIYYSRRADEASRPACGSNRNGLHYNGPLHWLALVIILFLSTFACSIPIIARRFPKFPVPHRFLFLSRHFGTGVLLATAFVHLLPTAFVSLTDKCLPPFWNEGYPAMAGFIALVSVLVVVGVEMFFATRGAGHIHGAEYNIVEQEPGHAGNQNSPFEGYERNLSRDARTLGHFRERSSKGSIGGLELSHNNQWGGSASTGEQDQPKSPLQESSSDLAASDAEVDLDESVNGETTHDTIKIRKRPANGAAGETMHDLNNSHAHEGEVEAGDSKSPITQAEERKLLLQCLLLEAGILFHSVFIGMALSVAVGTPFLVLLVAISFHQTFEGFALGSRIAAITSFGPKSIKPWLMALAYGITTPIGQAIGLGVHNLYDPASEMGLIMVGIFNSMSSGLLLFAGLVELLAPDFLSDESYQNLQGRKRLEACGAVVAGALLMALVGAWA